MGEATFFVTIKEIIQERSDVKTFIFERADGQPLHYEAGQFLTFLIDMHGHQVRRSYSMSSAPGVDAYPGVTIKRVANGEISRFWIDTVRVGDTFEVLAPSGRFVLEKEDEAARDIVLIGAGSGITPLFSMLKYALARQENNHLTLIYANSNTRQTIFLKEIISWQNQYPDRFSVIHVHSQPHEDWNGIRGRINNTRLEQLVRKSLRFEAADARFFICGPYDLMRSAEITLHFMGFTTSQIRKENFVIPSPPPPPPISFPHTISLNLYGSTHALVVPAHATILDAALAQGLRIPYSCRGGRCSTCAAICKSGKVHMSVNEVLTERDLQLGWILTCSAYVDSDDVVIELT